MQASPLFLVGLFRFGVELLVDFFEVLVGDVSVDLCGRNISVAEHGLYGADVGTVHK